MSYKKEMKGITLLQDRGRGIAASHEDINAALEATKKDLLTLGASELTQCPEFDVRRQVYLDEMEQITPLEETSLEDIYDEAETHHPFEIGLSDILSIKDFAEAQHRVDRHILDFNKHYSLDCWDYAIAGGCGLFAAMLDILCVNAPPKPTVKWNTQVDGVFNRWTQNAFNKLIPPDLSKKLSEANTIGVPDCSTVDKLIGAPFKALNPTNHRLRAMSHDPILGLIMGVWDMKHGTWTGIVDGKIVTVLGKAGETQGNVFRLLARMFKHLLSDVNAPSKHANRGMGLPAPFMGLLRMFDGIPVGSSTFDKQIEWMYVNGYDFRQFITSSIPVSIMEVMLRAFYVAKQVKLYDAPFGQTLLDTMPTRLNPRFRMMLAASYGVAASVNAGKCYITKNLLNANYAAWMGLVWNGFHAFKWAVLNRHLKLWSEVEAKEITEIESLVVKMSNLEMRAVKLPS